MPATTAWKGPTASITVATMSELIAELAREIPKRGTCQGSSREPRLVPVIGADARLFEGIVDLIVRFQERLDA